MRAGYTTTSWDRVTTCVVLLVLYYILLLSRGGWTFLVKCFPRQGRVSASVPVAGYSVGTEKVDNKLINFKFYSSIHT